MKDRLYKYKLVLFSGLGVIICICGCIFSLPVVGGELKIFSGIVLGLVASYFKDKINEIWDGKRDQLAPPDYDLTLCNKKSKESIDYIKKEIRSKLYRNVCGRIDDELDSFIEEEICDNKFIYFLRGEPGVGKSTLLALKAEKCQKSKHIVAYISGNSMENENFTLSSTISDFFVKNNRQGNIENLLKKLNANFNKKENLNHKFILIIDGINQSCNSNKILEDLLKNYVPLFEKYPWCRVVISMHNQCILTYQDEFVGNNAALLNKACRYTYNSHNVDDFGTELSILSCEECREIYTLLKEQKDKDRKDNNSTTNWTELPKDIQKILNNYEFIHLFFSKKSENTDPVDDVYSLMNRWKEQIYEKSQGLKMAISTVVTQLVKNNQNSYIDDISRENSDMANAISLMKKELILKNVVDDEGRVYCDFSSKIIADVFFAEYIQNKVIAKQKTSEDCLKCITINILDEFKDRNMNKLLDGIVYYLKESISKLKNYTSSEDKINAIDVIFGSLCCVDYQLPPHSSHLFTHGRAQSVYEIRALFEVELEKIDAPHEGEFFSYNSYQMSLALIRIREYDKAIVRLKTLSELSFTDTSLNVAMNVYLALAYISKSEYKTAEEILEKIDIKDSTMEGSRLGHLGLAILSQLKPEDNTPFPEKDLTSNKERLAQVENCFTGAIAFAEKDKDKRSSVYWNCHYGYYLHLIGKTQESMEIFRGQEKLSQEDVHVSFYFKEFFKKILSVSSQLPDRLRTLLKKYESEPLDC